MSPIEQTVKGLTGCGCGMSIAGLHTVTPGRNTINGTSAGCVDGLPASHVTRKGEAIQGGWALIQALRGGQIELVTGQEGYDAWKACPHPYRCQFPRQ